MYSRSTEIGQVANRLLPRNWKIWRFDQIATNVNIRIDNPSESGMEHYVGLEHLDPDSLRIRRWGSPSDVEAGKLFFKTGDIIFAKRRAYQRKLGVAEFDGICSAHAMVLRAKPEVVLPEFLPFFMQSDLFMNRAVEISVGSLSPTINWKTMAEQRFALPSMEEQHQIVEVMTATESLLEAIKTMEFCLMRARSSIAVEYFSSPSRHTLKPCSELIRTGDLSLQTGPFGTVLKASAYAQSGHPIINPVNMKNGALDIEDGPFVGEDDWQRLEKYWMRTGDMVMGRKGDMSNLIFVQSEYDRFLVGSDCIRFRVNPDRINQRYFFHFLRSETTQNWIQGQAYGTVMPGINEKILGRLMAYIPPLIEQERIAAEFDECEISLSNISKRFRDSLALKTSLLRDKLRNAADV